MYVLVLKIDLFYRCEKEKEEVSESEKDELIARLQKIERKQRTEISRYRSILLARMYI